MSTRPDWHTTLLRVAGVIAQRSTCNRLAVGCVITDLDHRRTWMGYNGGPRGGRNGCARDEPGNCGCLHAETNALILVDDPGPKIAAVTHAPCELCSVALVNAGVVEVVYSIPYRNTAGVETLAAAGVAVVHPERRR